MGWVGCVECADCVGCVVCVLRVAIVFRALPSSWVFIVYVVRLDVMVVLSVTRLVTASFLPSGFTYCRSVLLILGFSCWCLRGHPHRGGDTDSIRASFFLRGMGYEPHYVLIVYWNSCLFVDECWLSCGGLMFEAVFEF